MTFEKSPQKADHIYGKTAKQNELAARSYLENVAMKRGQMSGTGLLKAWAKEALQ